MTAVGTWDVAVIGGGPAGLSAAHAAASAGARTIVLERASHPRYKRCGGGLTWRSNLASGIDLQVGTPVHTVTFSLRGSRHFTHPRVDPPLLAMVDRSKFDELLKCRSESAGVTVREFSHVKHIEETGDALQIVMLGGNSVHARAVVGADGSAGVTSRYVGATFSQVDLGLEMEIAVPASVQRDWAGQMLIDWGPIPGSYGWVFPKEDHLTVGVIADRRHGLEARSYLCDFLDQLNLTRLERTEEGGHLTRCRHNRSPLSRGRLLLAGDAAGLLDPWTREGISYALRSGRRAGAAAAQIAFSSGPDEVGYACAQYGKAIATDLAPEMTAGFKLLKAFEKHPAIFHWGLNTRIGRQMFGKLCRDERPNIAAYRRTTAKVALAIMST